jgi:hypothetical protein
MTLTDGINPTENKHIQLDKDQIKCDFHGCVKMVLIQNMAFSQAVS